MKLPAPRLLLGCIAALFAFTSAHSEVLIAFGSAGPVAGKFKASGNAAAQLAVEDVDGALKIRSPNFWTTQAQGTELGIDLTKASPKDFLAIEIKGTVTDEKPILRLILLSADWSQKSEYTFDLSGINPDTFTVVKARSALGTPDNAIDTNLVDLGVPVGVAQILTTAQLGNRSWRLELKSLQIVKP
jgi:hypothetical protein